MAPQSYPSTVDAFKIRFPDSEEHTIHTLTEKEAKASGSSWTVKHLEACRVILKIPTTNGDLLILQSYILAARTHLTSLRDLKKELSFLTSNQIKGRSSRELREQGGRFGALFSRLAAVMETPAPPPKARPQREGVRPPQRDDNFVSGANLGLTPNRPAPGAQLEDPSPYNYSQQSADSLDEEVHRDRTKRESASHSLASEFISSISDLCTTQTSRKSRIEFNFVPTRYAIITQSGMACISEDDGSLIHRHMLATEWHQSDRVSLCCVEVKSKFETWNEDGDKAQISERVLAQQVSELLGSLLQRLDKKDLEDNEMGTESAAVSRFNQ
jgi:hypothetical protein